MSNKPQLSRGTRDFGPLQVARRKYILNTIEQVFKNYGFMPIETPAMEQLSTLMGKYGAEGDQLLFKILNSGNYFKDLIAFNNKGLAHEEFDKTYLPSFSGKVNDLDEKNALNLIAEKGLRYDLTVPFARYVVMNQHDIVFPFKRYQMQPVWRADKPQKGRYREFWQCDADVVGSNSLIYETELIQIYHQVFTLLGLDKYLIKVNNRKILAGITEVLQIQNYFNEFTIALDKLDKIGEEGVIKEIIARNIPADEQKLAALFTLNKRQLSYNNILDALYSFGLPNTEIGLAGLNEMKLIFEYLNTSGLQANITFNPTLARGLSYYTGCIFEAVNQTGSLKSSIGGGGRYDNLTGVFGLHGISGVGISFGLDRIYDVLEELSLFPNDVNGSSAKVLICALDESLLNNAIGIAAVIRAANIATEIYPDAAKLKKQLGYADVKKIPYTLIIGQNEINSGIYSLKNMQNGEQHQLSLNDIIKTILNS